MTKTAKGYLKALKEELESLDKYFDELTEHEKETFYEGCRAYATFCEPLIYTDRERLEELRTIHKRINPSTRSN